MRFRWCVERLGGLRGPDKVVRHVWGMMFWLEMLM